MMKLKLKDPQLAVQRLSQDRVAKLVAQRQAQKIAAAKQKAKQQVAPPPMPAPEAPSPAQAAPLPTPVVLEAPQPSAPEPPKKKVQKKADPTHYQNMLKQIKWLRKTHPLTFFTRGDQRPLKIGIHNDLKLAHPDLSKKSIKESLTFYCGNGAYLSACVTGADRVDLEGTVCGQVTESEAAISAARLAQRCSKKETTVPDEVVRDKAQRLREFEAKLLEATK